MSARSSKRLVGGSKVVIDDGAHVVVEELCHMPDLSSPPKRSPNKKHEDKVTFDGDFSRIKHDDNNMEESSSSSSPFSSSSAQKKKSRTPRVPC